MMDGYLNSNCNKKDKAIPVTGHGRHIGLPDVKAPTSSRQLGYSWQWSFQPYPLAALYPQEDFLYSFLLEAGSTQDQNTARRVRSIEKSNDPLWEFNPWFSAI
jgi:hypothetical protein